MTSSSLLFPLPLRTGVKSLIMQHSTVTHQPAHLCSKCSICPSHSSLHTCLHQFQLFYTDCFHTCLIDCVHWKCANSVQCCCLCVCAQADSTFLCDIDGDGSYQRKINHRTKRHLSLQLLLLTLALLIASLLAAPVLFWMQHTIVYGRI